ncbi:hypothetical protein L293_0782 [Acinetobacter gyllenbergii CIP 110306 = MTCC 11365]|nr:hypothetical protein L293_0782 [Acinetobacter gyllenbergii CIP 110306 = MTCC 11365]
MGNIPLFFSSSTFFSLPIQNNELIFKSFQHLNEKTATSKLKVKS